MNLSILNSLNAEAPFSDTPFLEAQTGTCRVDIFYAERQMPNDALGFQSKGSMHPIYIYQVITDADLPTPVTFTLIQVPNGMTIDSHSGRILWDYWGINHDGNSSNDVASGSYTVTVSVSDLRGYTATQTFTLTLQL